MIKFVAAVALAACAVGPAAAEPQSAQYQVEAEVRDGGATPARPRLLVASGQPATIQIANQDYSLRLTATPDSEANVAITSLVTSWSAGGLVHQDRQVQVRADGTPAQLRFSRTDPASGELRELAVDIRILPAAR